MENIELLVDLSFAMGAALLGGFVAHLLKQPVILGYLVAGILIGPYTPGPVTSIDRVQTLANLGVALLMFALGTEFSMEALQRVRRVAVLGGGIQLVLTIVLGTLIGLSFGHPLSSAIFLGGVISIASSILILKLLIARGDLESIAGRAALGTGIVQDMATVAMIIVLPALGGGIGIELLTNVGGAILSGGLFLVLAYLLGTRLVPPLLAAVARFGSRELFLLTIFAIAVGMSVLGHVAGISFALGAFMGGLVVAESEFSSEVLDEIIPIRDLFSTLFFVSIGMLMDPAFLGTHLLEISVLVAAILVGKFAITYGVVRLMGYSSGNARRVGLLLAQIGEFSFVLAGVGLAREAISEELYGLILAAALVTLILNPLIVNNAERLGAPLGKIASFVGRRLPGLPSRAPREVAPAPGEAEQLENLKRHVIVCGYGRVGREVARALIRRGFHFVIVDYNPVRIEEARREGCLAIQGDATNPTTQARAGLPLARMLVVALPDLASAELVTRAARALNPRLEILTRTNDARAIPRLKAAGATEVIQPEFEAGMEMVRQALRKYGVSSLETQSILSGRRQEHYTGQREVAPLEEPWA